MESKRTPYLYQGETATIILISNRDCWKAGVAYRGIFDAVAGEYADKSSAKAAAEQQAREWIKQQCARPGTPTVRCQFPDFRTASEFSATQVRSLNPMVDTRS